MGTKYPGQFTDQRFIFLSYCHSRAFGDEAGIFYPHSILLLVTVKCTTSQLWFPFSLKIQPHLQVDLHSGSISNMFRRMVGKPHGKDDWTLPIQGNYQVDKVKKVLTYYNSAEGDGSPSGEDEAIGLNAAATAYLEARKGASKKKSSPS